MSGLVHSCARWAMTKQCHVRSVCRSCQFPILRRPHSRKKNREARPRGARRPSSPLQSIHVRSDTPEARIKLQAWSAMVARKNVLRTWLRMGNITTLAEVAESRRAFISLPEWRIFNSLHSPFLSFGSSFSCVPRWSIHSVLLLYCPGSVVSRFTRLRRLSDLVENAAVY